MSYQHIDQFIEKNTSQSLNELFEFCKIPSIAAQNKGLNEAAEFVKTMLEKRGFSVTIHPTNGAPVVVAERKGKTDKTLLFYNHYDVQPPEPLELWDSDPFEPEFRGNKAYGRGISDDKGHLCSRIFAIDAILSTYGELPCNIKFVVEGEEEIGSINLPEFIKKNKQSLQADACIWEFGGVNHEDTPMQYLGMRGICYVELTVRTASMDTHSGLGGSIFPNAAWRLVWALNTLKDRYENIRIPGFYDDVLPPTHQDIEYLKQLPDNSTLYKKLFGIEEFLGKAKKGYELWIEEVFQPTCTICGLKSGYQGEGSKTVLPAQASAKIDFRLVPNQDPEKILELLRTHLDNEGFEDIEISYLGGDKPARTDPNHPFVKLVVEEAEPVYGKPMAIVPIVGGSGPNHAFIHELNLPVVTAGMGYPETYAHAPNENIRLDLYAKTTKHVAHVIDAFSKQNF